MITYERIAEVNKDINYISIHGKNYAEVAQRVQGFRRLYPEGYITTEIISMQGNIVYMKAEAGFYGEDGQKHTLATGLAFERQDASNINKTSFIENCETSAIGRALGFVGIGSEQTIASREELEHAIATQNAIENGVIPDPVKPQAQPKPQQQAQPKPQAKAQPAQVTTAATVPQMKPIPQTKQAESNPVLTYLAKEREELRMAREIDKAENTAIWNKQIEVLKANGIVPNKPLSKYTKEEAQKLVSMMYTRFDPHGTELKADDGEVA